MIYERTKDNKARFVLGEKGERTLVIFGVNPSTADDVKLDRTVTRVTRYAKKQGFDGWLMFNLYAQRKTDPKCLDKDPDPEYLRGNLMHVAQHVDKGSVIWAAWGNLIVSRKFLTGCLNEINRALLDKKCAGR